MYLTDFGSRKVAIRVEELLGPWHEVRLLRDRVAVDSSRCGDVDGICGNRTAVTHREGGEPVAVRSDRTVGLRPAEETHGDGDRDARFGFGGVRQPHEDLHGAGDGRRSVRGPHADEVVGRRYGHGSTAG